MRTVLPTKIASRKLKVMSEGRMFNLRGKVSFAMSPHCCFSGKSRLTSTNLSFQSESQQGPQFFFYTCMFYTSLALNESLVLLSGCLQMMTVKTKQMRKMTTSMLMAQIAPLIRTFLARTAKLQKLTIRKPENKKH